MRCRYGLSSIVRSDSRPIVNGSPDSTVYHSPQNSTFSGLIAEHPLTGSDVLLPRCTCTSMQHRPPRPRPATVIVGPSVTSVCPLPSARFQRYRSPSSASSCETAKATDVPSALVTPGSTVGAGTVAAITASSPGEVGPVSGRRRHASRQRDRHTDDRGDDEGGRDADDQAQLRTTRRRIVARLARAVACGGPDRGGRRRRRRGRAAVARPWRRAPRRAAHRCRRIRPACARRCRRRRARRVPVRRRPPGRLGIDLLRRARARAVVVARRRAPARRRSARLRGACASTVRTERARVASAASSSAGASRDDARFGTSMLVAAYPSSSSMRCSARANSTRSGTGRRGAWPCPWRARPSGCAARRRGRSA